MTPEASPRRAIVTDDWPAPIAEETVHATVSVPGSKSETNRALVLAAVSHAPSTITGGLDARDTQLMRAALRRLGVKIEDSRQTWHVTPPSEFTAGGGIDCGLAGNVMRFVPALAALADGETGFGGDEQALVRPMLPLLTALEDIGAGVRDDGAAGHLPFTITGREDLPGGPVILDSSTSSQYISGLLMAAPRFARGLDLRHVGDPVPSMPHIAMTITMLRERGVDIDDSEPDRWVVQPGPVQAIDQIIEPDLSNAAVFLAAAAITGGVVTVPRWPLESNQPGSVIAEILATVGAQVEHGPEGLTVRGTGHLAPLDIDLSAASELTPVVAAIAAVAPGASTIRGVAHIRGHETDRLKALAVELNNLGSHVSERDDGLTIHPRLLHGGLWRTYADHRMAHAGALLGLLVDEISLDDISCTSKTMPEFEDLWLDMLTQSDAHLADEMRGAGARANTGERAVDEST